MNHNSTLARGVAAIANLFAPAFGRIRINHSGLAKPEADDQDGIEVLQKRGGYSGAKLARKARQGRVGMATLR